MMSRNLPTWTSDSSLVRRSGEMLDRWRIRFAVVGPIPKMYVRATSIRLSRGTSTPAIRATCSLPLPLLVLWILTYDPDSTVPLDDFAPIADLFHRGPDLHDVRAVLLLLCQALKYSPPTEVGCAESRRYPVAWPDSDRLKARLANEVTDHLVPIVQLDPVELIGQDLDDPAHQSLTLFPHRTRRIGPEDSHERPLYGLATAVGNCAAGAGSRVPPARESNVPLIPQKTPCPRDGSGPRGRSQSPRRCARHTLRLRRRL